MPHVLNKKLSETELVNMTQTIVLKKKPAAEPKAEYKPKVRYIAAEDATILKIMGGVDYALRQKNLPDRADELKRLILSGSYEEPMHALELFANYVQLDIVAEDGRPLATLG